MEINLTSSTIMSYRGLMRTIQNLLYTSWGKNKVQFVSAYPKKTDSDSIRPPIITYGIDSKTPGSFGQTSERKPRYRETLKINEMGKEIPVELSGQVFDYRILFEIWAEDGDTADEIAERFQLFMSQYAGYLKKVGVIELLFERMDGGTGSARWKSDLIRRAFVYHIRLDEVSSVKCQAVEEIVISTLTHNSTENMLLNLHLLSEDESREILYEGQVTITSGDDSD